MDIVNDHALMLRKSAQRKYAGLEFIEIHPIRLGGDGADANNIQAINRRGHIEYVRYWNRMIRSVRSSPTESPGAK